MQQHTVRAFDAELEDLRRSMAEMGGITFERGEDALTTYRFHTGTAKHFFCSVCGIKSFYVPRSHPDGYSINFRCLDDPKAFHSVVTTEFDGKEWEKNAGDLAPLEAR